VNHGSRIVSKRFAHIYDHEPIRSGERSAPVFWVECPRCKSCAYLSKESFRTKDQALANVPSTLKCLTCGYIKRFLPGSKTENWDKAARKRHYSYRLWLQCSCCGHVLRASSPRHLAFLSDYVSALLRERLRRNWPDKDLLAKLPKWFCLARNRAEILRCIKRLQNKIALAAPSTRPVGRSLGLGRLTNSQP